MSMHPLRQRRLIWIAVLIIVISSSFGLILYALRQNISLFYSPSQLIAGSGPVNKSIRAGGLVVKGSVIHSAKDLSVRFKITDQKEIIHVIYTGILPDLFREGQGIVVQGKWRTDHFFIASRVLAKHDENYMPPEVQAALQSPRVIKQFEG